MPWFFHSRVLPRPGNRTGDQATGILFHSPNKKATLVLAPQVAEKHRIFASNLYSYGWSNWLSVFNIFLEKPEYNRPIIWQTQHNPAKLYLNSKGWILSHGFALFICRNPHFTGPWFDTKCKNEIGCMYPYDICNNFIDFSNFDFLILSGKGMKKAW